MMEKIMLPNNKDFYEKYYVDDLKRGVIVIAPGGGYSHTSPREGKPVALFFNSIGYHAVVISYREELTNYPIPMEEVSYVVNELKKDKLIDENKIIGCGFSAGGHLILASQFLGFAKFNGLIMGYPVVSSDEKIAHLGSFRDLLGPKFIDEEMRKLVSIENQITPDAPDLFLWTTLTDQAVPMENSLRLVEAYHMVGANVEFHLYPLGMHGLSLATKETSGGDDNKVIEHIQSWMLLVKNWLKLKF